MQFVEGLEDLIVLDDIKIKTNITKEEYDIKKDLVMQIMTFIKTNCSEIQNHLLIACSLMDNMLILLNFDNSWKINITRKEVNNDYYFSMVFEDFIANKFTFRLLDESNPINLETLTEKQFSLLTLILKLGDSNCDDNLTYMVNMLYSNIYYDLPYQIKKEQITIVRHSYNNYKRVIRVINLPKNITKYVKAYNYASVAKKQEISDKFKHEMNLRQNLDMIINNKFTLNKFVDNKYINELLNTKVCEKFVVKNIHKIMSEETFFSVFDLLLTDKEKELIKKFYSLDEETQVIIKAMFC
ncbi:hypothetical protein Hokovirus_3_10 [Hokovirus HKV1]|uniref:Uncharacterized protein n=1 Tax=Hokovirus HKV1 TaxID=1977638 RepID=A0A1V0SGA2_9VIRU|nr:hypothetical protein Hokovirus_3_10 [Hokovirus HKV1]